MFFFKMGKKIVNTYQVSFAKSLDISKDYKKKKNKIYNKIEKKYNFISSIQKLFDNEDLLEQQLNNFGLNGQLLAPNLLVKLEKFKFLDLKINFKILIYRDGGVEINPLLPSTTDLLKYFNSFDWGANNPSYGHNLKKLVVKNRRFTEKIKYFAEKNDFKDIKYESIVSISKLKVLFFPVLGYIKFSNLFNQILGSVLSLKPYGRAR